METSMTKRWGLGARAWSRVGRSILGALVLMGCASGETTGSSDQMVTSSSPSVPKKTEVKVLLADPNFDPSQLGGTPVQRDITFFDTVALTLHDKGLLLRARRADGPGSDFTVKLRPMTQDRVDPSFQQAKGFKCNLDMPMGTEGESQCSITEDADADAISASLSSSDKIKDLFDDTTLRYAEVPVGPLDPGSLRPLGPIKSTVWDVQVDELGGKVSFERWDVPGDPTLEASITVASDVRDDTSKKLIAWLASQGQSPAAQQQEKTSAALAAFAHL
jgi:hypothetical protein